MVVPCKEEQQRRASQNMHNRVRSALTQLVTTFFLTNVNNHQPLLKFGSGQLRFLGLIPPLRFLDVIGKLLAFLVHPHQIGMGDAEQRTHHFVCQARLGIHH